MTIERIISNPQFLKKILNIPNGCDMLIDKTSKINSLTSHIYIINLVIKEKHSQHNQSIFIKYSNSYENRFQNKLCQNEIVFYNNVKKINSGINVIPYCFYADGNDRETILVLKNISNSFYTITETEITEHLVMQCVSSLAYFHSAFWNNANIISFKAGIKFTRLTDIDQIGIYDFISQNSHFLSKSAIKIINKSVDITKYLLNEINIRKKNIHNITLINGDAHIYNFMFSKEIDSTPIIIDFQFAESGLGCLDLAHLTRKIPPQILTYEFCHNIVNKYYQSLLRFGIKNYTFSECYNDYRKCISVMVLNPIWQNAILKLPIESCILSLNSIFEVFNILDCQQLHI